MRRVLAPIKTAKSRGARARHLLDLQPSVTVADVGAGFGAWTMRFSKVVGPSGRVYATDIGATQLAARREMKLGATNPSRTQGRTC